MEALRLLAETPTRNHDEIEKLLSCPICLDIFSKPVVILPCQHNLCRQCAQDMFENRGTVVGSGGRFKCPSCRYDVVLDRHGVHGLQQNLLVENIIDMYQSQGTKTSFKKNEQFLACDDHEDEKVNIYCTTCQKPTCSLCKVFGQHQNCDVAPMEKIYKEQKRELSDAISVLSEGNDGLQGIISQTEELGTQTERNAKKVELDLSRAFDALYEVLDKKKEEMTRKLATDLQERRQVLEAMLTNHKQQLEASNKLMTSSLSLIDERSVPQFLKLAREMIEKVVQAASLSENRQPPFRIENMSEFHVNFHFQNEILSKLDFTPLNKDNSTKTRDDDVMFDRRASLFESQHCDVIDEEGPDFKDDFSDEDEAKSLLVTGSDSMSSLEDDLVSTRVANKSPQKSSESNQDEETEAGKGKWFDMYVRQLPSPVSMSGFSAPMESSVHMKVIIPPTAIFPEEEDLKKENPTENETTASDEIDDLDSEIERLLYPRRRGRDSRVPFHSSTQLSPRSSPSRFGSYLLQDETLSPDSSPLFNRRQHRLRNMSPPPLLVTSQSTSSGSKANRVRALSPSGANFTEVKSAAANSRRQKQAKPISSLGGRSTSPPHFSANHDKNQERKRSDSPTEGQSARRPRLYCTHKRRTWSHLLDKN